MACHSGKLLLVCTRLRVFLTSPKNFLISSIDYSSSVIWISRKTRLPFGLVKNRIHRPDRNPLAPGYRTRLSLHTVRMAGPCSRTGPPPWAHDDSRTYANAPSVEFLFLLLWSCIFESYCLVGFCLSGLQAFRSFCLTFQFPFRREVQFCPCEFNCGRHYCQFVYILCAGWRHPKLFNHGVLSQTFDVSLLVILSFRPVEQ